MFLFSSAFLKKWQHLAPFQPGEKKIANGILCGFFDPRFLELLLPQSLPTCRDSRFLRKISRKKRKYVYGHRDRVDEVRDFARSVRDEKYLYIRNYMPHLGYNQPTAWPDIGEIRHEFYKLAKSGKMTPAQSHFAGPRRPIEELYDCENDPLNLKNLANSSNHQKILKRMRNEHLRYALEIRDWGYIPEYEAWEMKQRVQWMGREKAKNVSWKKIIEAADLVGRAKETKFITNLKSQNETIRYWAAIGLGAYEKPLSNNSLSVLEIALKDSSPSVRIEAANALIRNGNTEPALSILKKELEHKNLIVVTHAARTIELLGEKAKRCSACNESMFKTCLCRTPARSFPSYCTSWRSGYGDVCRLFLQRLLAKNKVRQKENIPFPSHAQ